MSYKPRESLELEESDLFDLHGDDPVNISPEMTHASLREAACGSDSESDDGIQLDIDEDSSSDGDQEVAHRGAFLLSSAEISAPMQDIAGSHTSLVGSLKRFDSLGRSVRPFRSESDLPIAASMPTRTFHAPATRAAWPRDVPTNSAAPSGIGFTLHDGDDEYNLGEDSKGYGNYNLGTSMPIRIPHMMMRRGLMGSPGSLEMAANGNRGGAGLNFTPPHLLDGVDRVGDVDGTGLSLHGSPSGLERREKLRARNAILRSTGFIEGAKNTKAQNMEVVDIVKESIIGIPSSRVAMPGSRIKPASSLSALLGTSS